MGRKKYATQDQRKFLAMAGIEHLKGRSDEEADALIESCIKQGLLPSDIRNRATIRQLKKLDELGVTYPKELSKQEASDLIDRHNLASESQLDFLRGMGIDPPANLTLSAASKLIDEQSRDWPISEGQARLIHDLGGVVDRSMTYASGKQFIDYLSVRESRCSRCNGRNNRRSDRCACGAYLPKSSPIRPPSSLCSRIKSADDSSANPSVLNRFLRWLGL